MTRTIVLCGLAVPMLWAAGMGCGDDAPERKPSEMLQGWQGPPPRIQITVTGPDADEEKREKCGRLATAAGIAIDPMAPVQGILTLGGRDPRFPDSPNLLKVVVNGAIASETGKPSWDMEHLCNDAILALLSAARQNPQAGGGYAGPPPGAVPMVTVQVSGPAANEDKRQRCNAIVQKQGGTTDPNAAVRAILNLADGNNSLQVSSARRGIVLNQQKPSGWGMEQLCTDAYQAGLSVLQQELASGPAFNQPPGYGGPPPGYQPPPQGYQPPPQGYQPPPQQSAPPGTVAVSPMQPSPGAPKNVADLAQRGLADFGRRDYAAALTSFTEASHTGNDPAMLFDAGLCYYMLHRPQEALQHMQLYIDRAPQAPNRNQADALIADLHRQLGMDE